jgi:tripeptidyl-peptidase I
VNGTKTGSVTDDSFTNFLIQVAAQVNPPTSLSISWGGIEQYFSPFTITAFNNEAMKLGLRGVTILVSSGDNGAVGNGCGCNTNSSSSKLGYWTGPGTWTGVGYFPSHPASSPYVVAVGATAGPESGTAEVACQVRNTNSNS